MKKYSKKGLFYFTELLIVIPILMVMLISVKSKDAYYNSMFSLYIEELTLENYVLIFRNKNMWIKIINSIIVTFLGSLICLFIAVPFSYALTQIKKKDRFIILLILLIFLFVPEEITIAIKYRLCIRLKLLNSIPVTIILLAFRHVPIVMFMLYFAFLTIFDKICH